MRKITLLMLLFCATCIGVMAQVTQLSGLSNDKCYTVVAPRSAWAVARGSSELTTTYQIDASTSSEDSRQQFAFLSVDGENYYIYSVSEGKFLNSNNTLTYSKPDYPIQFTDASSKRENAVMISFKGIADKFINIDSGKQILINAYKTADDGNAYFVTEAGNFDSSAALDMLRAVPVTITYNCTFNGEPAGTDTFNVLPGAAYPVPTLVAMGYVTASGIPEGYVREQGEYSVDLSVSPDFPFEYSATESDDLKWYFLRFRDVDKPENPNYLQVEPGNTEKYAVTAGGRLDNQHLWAFVGNPVQGFKILNKATGTQQLAVAAADSANGSFPLMAENGTTWMIVKSNRAGYNDGRHFGIKVSTAEKYINNYSLAGYLSIWQEGPTLDAGSNITAISSSLMDDSQKLAFLQNVIDAAKAYPIGEGLHKFTVPADVDFAGALAAAEALAANVADASFEELCTVSSALDAAVASLKINQPQPNRFYRFKGATNNNRLTSTENGNNKLNMVADEDNGRQTIFLLTEDHKLVAYETGLCLGNFSSSYGNSAWKCLPANNSLVGTVEFKPAVSIKGKYLIAMKGSGVDRHLYHANATVDCGDNSMGEGYRWDIEEVTLLPVAMNTDAGYATLCSPVALGRGGSNDSDDCVKAYIGELKEDHVSLTEVAGDIPANTPVVLQYVTGVENGNVYLPVRTSETSGETVAENCFDGTMTTEPVSEIGNGGIVCTLQLRNGKTGFYRFTGDDMKAFKAYLVVENSQEGVRGFTLDFGGNATGIDNMDMEASDEAYYDLKGRRVLYPVRGIYLTASGKKVFVK